MISSTFKTVVNFCGLNLSFEEKDFSDRSLRAAGYMALLCAGANIDIIKIIDFWHSDEILLYINIQAEIVTRNLSHSCLHVATITLWPVATPVTQESRKIAVVSVVTNYRTG